MWFLNIVYYTHRRFQILNFIYIEMKRHMQMGISLFSFVLMWVGWKLIYSENEQASWYLNILPFYCIILFGCYCLARLGLDLLTFNDYPEEIMKLTVDIAAAKEDLRQRGFKDN